MKCDTCRYNKMCRLKDQFIVMLEIIADITDIKEPEYTRGCKVTELLFDGCVNYEEKE